jgi:hypothetical protein
LVVEGLRQYRSSGLRLDTHIARGYILGIINHSAPELLRARASDGSVFKVSDSWVRKLLREKLNFVPRKATRAAQKIPVNAEELMTRSFMRNAYIVEFFNIEHAELMVDIDQTQVRGLRNFVITRKDADELKVVVQDTTGSTFAKRGSKQVELAGKEEKRAWTAVVGVSKAGKALPLQIIMKGGTMRSLPHSYAAWTDEANKHGIRFDFNPKNYWSSLALMKTYVNEIITPYFLEQKRILGVPADGSVSFSWMSGPSTRAASSASGCTTHIHGSSSTTSRAV